MSGMKRPDIASAVGAAVARYAYNPPVRHWKAVRKTITYLNQGHQRYEGYVPAGGGLGVVAVS